MASEIIGLGPVSGLGPICLRLPRFAHIYPLKWHKYDPNVTHKNGGGKGKKENLSKPY